ncbi:MAG: oligosaccharide flippase family protein [Anaerolineae bacterium]|nr:oligosaccharide flippase family protein [Anaerolineae bacterium]
MNDARLDNDSPEQSHPMTWSFSWALLWESVRRRLLNRRFWRDTGLLMLANVIVMVLGLIRVPVVTRILSKDEVGMMGVVASILPFLQLLSLSGLDGATYHYVAKGYPAALQVNVSTRLRWSMLSTIGFLIGGVYWLLAGKLILAGLFTIAALTYPVTTGLTTVAGVLSAQERFVHLFWYRIGEALTRYVGFGLLLLLPVSSIRVLWFSLGDSVALAALQVGVAIWLINRLHQTKSSPMPPPEQREMIRYGKHLTALNSISTIQTKADGFLVGWFLPFGVMADYTIADLVYTQFKNLWAIYYAVRYPPLVRLPLARRRRRMILEMAVIWLAFILLGLAAGTGLWVLVPAILPSEYRSSLPFIGWLLAAFAVSIPGFFVETYFRTRQDERSQYALRGVAAICGVLFPLIFMLFWQGYGVVVGRFVAGSVLSIAGAYLFVQDVLRKPDTTLDAQADQGGA